MKDWAVSVLVLIFASTGSFGESLPYACTLKSVPPVLDGELAEWQGVAAYKMGVGNIVYGKRRWQGEADLSGTLWLAWDKSNLYLAAEVTDDVFVQNQIGGEIFLGDHLELDVAFLSPSRSGEENSFEQEIFAMGFSPGNFKNTRSFIKDHSPECHVWFPLDVDFITVSVSAIRTERGYNLEAKIPWFLLNLEAKQGLILSLDLRISDTDSSGEQDSMTSLFSGEWGGRERENLVRVKLTDGMDRRE